MCLVRHSRSERIRRLPLEPNRRLWTRPRPDGARFGRSSRLRRVVDRPFALIGNRAAAVALVALQERENPSNR